MGKYCSQCDFSHESGKHLFSSYLTSTHDEGEANSANMITGLRMYSGGADDNEILNLKSHDGGEPDGPEVPEQQEEIPELVTWTCKKGHTWKTYGEVAFMTFIDPLSSEEISTGPICVKCYFKSLTDYFSAERKDDKHGYRP